MLGISVSERSKGRPQLKATHGGSLDRDLISQNRVICGLVDVPKDKHLDDQARMTKRRLLEGRGNISYDLH